MRSKILFTLMIPIILISLFIGGKIDGSITFYNPFRCQEISYFHDRLVVFLENNSEGDQACPQGNRESRATAKFSNVPGRPVLGEGFHLAKILFFHLADDDLGTLQCCFQAVRGTDRY